MSKSGKMCYNISVRKSRRQARGACGDMNSGGGVRRYAGRPRNDEETAMPPFCGGWKEKVEKYI